MCSYFCRGILVIELLRKLEELTGRNVFEMFDFICGVSTGGIMAMLFGPHKKNLQDCSAMYKEISARVFNQSAFWGTSNLLWSHSYYDTALWEQILKTYIGEIQLIKTARDRQCPKVKKKNNK
jgi:calcium-independent phospholipase A2-gamma